MLVVPNGVKSAVKLAAHGMNLEPVLDQPTSITFVGVLSGTAVVTIYSFVAGWLFGWIYNRIDR